MFSYSCPQNHASGTSISQSTSVQQLSLSALMSRWWTPEVVEDFREFSTRHPFTSTSKHTGSTASPRSLHPPEKLCSCFSAHSAHQEHPFRTPSSHAPGALSSDGGDSSDNLDFKDDGSCGTTCICHPTLMSYPSQPLFTPSGLLRHHLWYPLIRL